MNILLSRILRYLNGTLFHDHYYKICTFIVFHYLEMDTMSEEEFLSRFGGLESLKADLRIQKAIDVLKKAGCNKNYTPNFLDLPSNQYTLIYNALPVSEKIYNAYVSQASRGIFTADQNKGKVFPCSIYRGETKIAIARVESKGKGKYILSNIALSGSSAIGSGDRIVFEKPYLP